MTQRLPWLLLYISAGLIGLTFWSMPINDPDLGWQLFGGAWIFSHGELPPFDPINTFNSAWVNYHWLAQLILYSIFSLGDYAALKISYGLVLGAIILLLVQTSRRVMGASASMLLTTLLLIFSVIFLSFISSIRPQMLALFLIALAQLALLKRDKKDKHLILIGLTIICVNIHVYWVFIPLLWFSYRILPALTRLNLPTKSNILFFALLCALGLVSPLGLDNYWVLFDYLKTPQILRTSISEFQSGFSLGGEAPAALLAFGLAGLLVFRKCRILASPGAFFMAATSFVLACMSAKFLGLLAILGLPYLARHGRARIRSVLPNLCALEPKFGLIVFPALGVLALFLAIVGLPKDKSQITEELNQKFPIQACQFLAQLNIQPSYGREHVRLLTHFNDGGWCRWILSQHAPDQDYRVTMDGRTQFVPKKRFEDSHILFKLEPGWEKVLSNWTPDAALIPRNKALYSELAKNPALELVFTDQTWAVFLFPLE